MTWRLILVLLLLVKGNWLKAQRISGRLMWSGPELPAYVDLLATRGAQHYSLDRATVGRNGDFAFNPRKFEAGFYQLSINDSDRVDIILDPREPEVVVAFDGAPLQEHILVRRSAENMRLWEYKLISRRTQGMILAAEEERRKLAVSDVVRARQLDSIEHAASVMKEGHLTRLLEAAPASYFARIVNANKGLDLVAESGPLEVLRTFDFSDPSLLRSSVYPKALNAYLQSARPTSEREFYAGLDTLIAAASGDTACWNYTIDYLLDLFSTYGPELAFEHVVDKHVAGHEAALPPYLRDKVRDQLTVAVGARGPDVVLQSLSGSHAFLSAKARTHRYTLLFFYSSTCDHCHEQIAGLRSVHQARSRDDLEIIGVALDSDTTEFLECLDKYQVTWPCFSEFMAWGSPAAKAYRVKATPSLYLLGPDLTIVAKPQDWQEVSTALDRLLGEH